MSSCNYCRHRRCGEWADYCRKDLKVEISPEGVREEWYPRHSWESLKHFRKKYGGRCPYFSNAPLRIWEYLMLIGLGVILLATFKKLLCE